MGIIVEIVKQVSQSVSLKRPHNPNGNTEEDEEDKTYYDLNYCFSSVILVDILRTHILKRYPIFLPFVLKLSVGKTIQKYLTEKYFLQRLSNPAASFLQFVLRVMYFIDSTNYQLFLPQIQNDCYV